MINLHADSNPAIPMSPGRSRIAGSTSGHCPAKIKMILNFNINRTSQYSSTEERRICTADVIGSSPVIGFCDSPDDRYIGGMISRECCCKLSGEVCAKFCPSISEQAIDVLPDLPICQAQKRNPVFA